MHWYCVDKLFHHPSANTVRNSTRIHSIACGKGIGKRHVYFSQQRRLSDFLTFVGWQNKSLPGRLLKESHWSCWNYKNTWKGHSTGAAKLPRVFSTVANGNYLFKWNTQWAVFVQTNAFDFAALRLTQSLFMEILAEIERKKDEGQKVVIPLSPLITTAMDKKHSVWGLIFSFTNSGNYILINKDAIAKQ